MGAGTRLLMIAALGMFATLAATVAHADTHRFVSRFTLTNPAPPNPSDPYDGFGSALAVGDVNGDRVPDIVASASNGVTAFSGETGAPLWTVPPPGGSHPANLDSVAIGDVDGDGEPEVVVGIPTGTSGGCFVGQVHILSGASGALGATLQSPNSACGDSFGITVALGATDRRRAREIIVGAPGESVRGQTNVGRVYVISGRTLQLQRTIDTPDPGELLGFGFRVRAATGQRGEIIAVDEVSVPAGGVPNAGRVLVFSGNDQAPDWVIDNPEPQLFQNFGAEAMDILSAPFGRPTIAIGAFNQQDLSNVQGRVYVFSGAALQYSLNTPNPQARSAFGISLSFADQDGLGASELVVGAPLESAGGKGSAGRIYVYSSRGKLLDTLVAPHPTMNQSLGFPVAVGNGRCGVILAVGGNPDAPPPAGEIDVFALGNTAHDARSCRAGQRPGERR